VASAIVAGEVPAGLRTPLVASAQKLESGLHCVPTPPAPPPHHRHHGNGHGNGEGQGNGNGDGQGDGGGD
jgi:hypothetical protein